MHCFEIWINLIINIYFKVLSLISFSIGTDMTSFEMRDQNYCFFLEHWRMLCDLCWLSSICRCNHLCSQLMGRLLRKMTRLPWLLQILEFRLS